MPLTRQPSKMEVDTGQTNSQNRSKVINNDNTEKEQEEMTENQASNLYDPILEEGVLGLLVEMEYERNANTQDEKLIADSLYNMHTLVLKWIENKVIDGVYSVGESHLEEDLEEYLNWAYHLRIVHRKHKSLVECSFEVRTTATAFQLYKD